MSEQKTTAAKMFLETKAPEFEALLGRRGVAMVKGIGCPKGEMLRCEIQAVKLLAPAGGKLAGAPEQLVCVKFKRGKDRDRAEKILGHDCWIWLRASDVEIKSE